ncbi:arginase [Penicillium brevicompactum]|uniref:Arginase n=1 Tax=Penicillium brevicompactum TaxID=5074 RepID=A0A9W9V0G5_PENBR|nr:arginase [Penicillium brevicompactum]
MAFKTTASGNPELAVVLAESSAGAPRKGSELGPDAILQSGLLGHLQSHFGKVHVCKLSGKSGASAEDLDYAKMKRPRTVSKTTQIIHDLVYSHIQQGRLVLTLGGDHSNAIGTLTGTTGALHLNHGQCPAVICVDAHVSINPPDVSPSGNIHGMPLAFATGLASCQEKGIFDWIRQDHLIDMKKLVYIGTRDIDDDEKTLIEENEIKVFGMDDIQRHGIDSIITMALEYIGDQTPIHLSCDIDALDPDRIHETGNLVAMDLVEVNPTINVDGVDQTISSACALITGALGLSA